ncbi:MAG: hypothetical protein ACJ75J_12680 [Cytophagaceae bacterium]
MPKTRFVNTKWIFIISLIVISITMLTIYISGLHIHRSIRENSLIYLSILSVSFFLFICCGLYSGMKLKDDVGNLTRHIKFTEPSGYMPDLGPAAEGTGVAAEAGGDPEGILGAIILWIVATIAIIMLIIFFDTIVWAGIMLFLAMLYWIFFRALRLVFKNSRSCKGDLVKSISYGAGYTILYSSWIYGIIFLSGL